MDIRSLCENSSKAAEMYGESASAFLRDRLADLRAATTIDDLVAGSIAFHDSQALSLELYDGYKLILEANHSSNPKTGDGKTDWQNVRRLKVMEITKL
jgi:hypothetical protein